MIALSIIISIIGIIGSFASIYGAHLSKKAEKVAVNAADRAEQARDTIVTKQQTTELVKVLFAAKEVQKSFGKYSLASSKAGLRGVNFDADALRLQELIIDINENREPIDFHTELVSNTLYADLNQLSDDFTNNKTMTARKENGDKIRRIADDLIHKLKKCVDDRNRNLE